MNLTFCFMILRRAVLSVTYLALLCAIFFYHIQLPQPAHKKDKEDELNKVCIETNLYFYC